LHFEVNFNNCLRPSLESLFRSTSPFFSKIFIHRKAVVAGALEAMQALFMQTAFPFASLIIKSTIISHAGSKNISSQLNILFLNLLMLGSGPVKMLAQGMIG